MIHRLIYGCCLLAAMSAVCCSHVQAAEPAPKARGFFFQTRVVTFVDSQLQILRDSGRWDGGEIAIVFLGIHNRWDQAWEWTQKNFDSGQPIVVVPTYNLPCTFFDVPGAVMDHARTGLPRTPVTTRKIGLPELLRHLERQDVQVSGMAFDSGGNFVLQENVAELERYARQQADQGRHFPGTIVVNSGGVSESAHAERLRDAGFQVTQTGEQALVTAVQQRFADYSFGRLPLLGVPGHLLNVLPHLGEPLGPEGRHGYSDHGWREVVNAALAPAVAYNTLIQGLTGSDNPVTDALNAVEQALDRQAAVTQSVQRALNVSETLDQIEAAGREGRIREQLDMIQRQQSIAELADRIMTMVQAEQVRLATPEAERGPFVVFPRHVRSDRPTLLSGLGATEKDLSIRFENANLVRYNVGMTRWSIVERKDSDEAFVMYDATGVYHSSLDRREAIGRLVASTVEAVREMRGKLDESGVILVGDPDSEAYAAMKEAFEDAGIEINGEVDDRGKTEEEVLEETDELQREVGGIAVRVRLVEADDDDEEDSVDVKPTDLTVPEHHEPEVEYEIELGNGTIIIIIKINGIPVWIIVIDESGNIIWQGPPEAFEAKAGTDDVPLDRHLFRAPPTPTLDRLATLGVRFSNAYSAHPLCSPKRGTASTSAIQPMHPIAATDPGTWLVSERLLSPTASVRRIPWVEERLANSLLTPRGDRYHRPHTAATHPEYAADSWAVRSRFRELRDDPVFLDAQREPNEHPPFAPSPGNRHPDFGFDGPVRFVSVLAAEADRERVAANEAVVVLVAPDGAQVTVNGRNYGTARRLRFPGIGARRTFDYVFRLRLPDGQSIQRTVTLSGGQLVRLAALRPDAEEAFWQLVVCMPADAPLDPQVLQLVEQGEYTRALQIAPGHARLWAERAWMWFEAREYDKAIADLDRAIEIDPKFAGAYGLRGETWLRVQEWDKAIADGTRAIQLDHNNADGHAIRGEAWLLKGELENAISDLTRAMELNPQYVEACECLAWAWLAKGDQARAIAVCDDLIRALPESAEPYGVRADIWLHVQKWDKAIADSTRAIELDENYANGHAIRGEAWRLKGEYDKAIADLDSAIAINPQSAFALAERGQVWLMKGEYDKALADLDKAITIDPQFAFALASRGAAWRKKSEYNKSVADLERAIQIDPEYRYAHEQLAWVWIDQNDFDKAMAVGERFVADAPDNAEAYLFRSSILHAFDRDDEAIADAKRAIRMSPDSSGAYSSLAGALHGKGDYAEAVAAYTKAIELAPGDFWHYLLRGNAKNALGEYDKAIADLERAQELNATLNYSAYVVLGNAWIGKAEPDRAISVFEKALALNPKCANAYGGRGVARIAKGELDKAIEDFDIAIRMSPLLLAAYANRAGAWNDQGDYLRAIADCEDALRLNAGLAAAHQNHARGAAYNNRATAWANLGQMDRALADYDAAIRLAPQLAAAYANRGHVRYALEQYDAALADYEQALQRSPDLSDALVGRAAVRLAKEDWDAAIADYDRVLRTDPSHAAALLGRGAAKRAREDYDGALADFHALVRTSPRSGAGYYARADLLILMDRHDDALADYQTAMRKRLPWW